MKRYTITLGATTTAGGKVISASSNGSINGSPIQARGVIDKIKDGDIEAGVSQASKQWAALPEGRGKTGRYNQPYVEFDRFEAAYKAAGGTTK